GTQAVPPLLVRVADRSGTVRPQHARIVVEDVEPAEVAGAVGDHAADVRLDRDVTDRGESPPAPPLDERDRLLRRIRVDVADDDARALLGEEQCGLPPDPHAGARDERDPAPEPSGHLLNRARAPGLSPRPCPAASPRRADSHRRSEPSHHQTRDGPRAARWSPAATGQRTRAAWSRDPWPVAVGAPVVIAAVRSARSCPSAPSPWTAGP